MTSPVRMNNGMAIRANESTPSNRPSPSSVSGRAPVDNRIATVPSPIVIQNGTPIASSATASPMERGTAIAIVLIVEHRLAREGRATGAQVGDVAHERLHGAQHDEGEAERHGRGEPRLVDPQ